MRRKRPDDIHTLPDDVPKDHLWVQPLRVARLAVDDVEEVEPGTYRVAFAAQVIDAEGKGCRDLAVDARIAGPERAGEGLARTDAFGEVFFRMTGPPGLYRCDVLDVAAGALDIERPDDPDSPGAPIASAQTTVAP